MTTTETWTATPRAKSTTSDSYDEFKEPASNNSKPKNGYSQPGNGYNKPNNTYNQPGNNYSQPNKPTYGNVKNRSIAPRASPMSTGKKKGFVSLSSTSSVGTYTTQEEEAETYSDY